MPTFSRLSALIVIAAAGSACETPTAPVTLVYADRPVVVPASALGWKAVSVGGSHTCGIRVDGTLYCWGGGASGQLGVSAVRGQCGRRATACEGGPRAATTPARFNVVSAGQRHTCAIATTGTLYCWGESIQFQTGVNGQVMVPTPQPLLPELRFVDVGAGVTHTCAVRTNGVIYCWGEGTLGALGRGDTVSSVVPAPISTSEKFVLVRSGRLRSCAIALDGAPWCWGSEWESTSNGFDFFHPRLLPHRIDGLPPLRDISVSSSSLCAVTVDGISLCWEANDFAQLGTGSVIGTLTPAPVATTERFASISSGIIQTCATTLDGVGLCWGNNSFGQLGVPRPGEHCGDFGLECSSRPIAVFGMLRFSTVVTGIGNHTCGISVETAIVCWGLGSEGQLGDGFTRDRQSVPVPVMAPVP